MRHTRYNKIIVCAWKPLHSCKCVQKYNTIKLEIKWGEFKKYPNIRLTFYSMGSFNNYVDKKRFFREAPLKQAFFGFLSLLLLVIKFKNLISFVLSYTIFLTFPPWFEIGMVFCVLMNWQQDYSIARQLPKISPKKHNLLWKCIIFSLLIKLNWFNVYFPKYVSIC